LLKNFADRPDGITMICELYRFDTPDRLFYQTYELARSGPTLQAGVVMTDSEADGAPWTPPARKPRTATMSDQDETKADPSTFDFAAFPGDTLFHDRREGQERRARARVDRPQPVRDGPRVAPERRAKKERRRRIDPTTFEKQYTDDELEFMNAMQRFKVQTGKSFPSHGEVLKVAIALGYRRPVTDDSDDLDEDVIENPDDGAEVSRLFESA
jgi:hypothetical protein